MAPMNEIHAQACTSRPNIMVRRWRWRKPTHTTPAPSSAQAAEVQRPSSANGMARVPNTMPSARNDSISSFRLVPRRLHSASASAM